MSALICIKCHKGQYVYMDKDGDREDWENRRMACIKCAHVTSIKKLNKYVMKKRPIRDFFRRSRAMVAMLKFATKYCGFSEAFRITILKRHPK